MKTMTWLLSLFVCGASIAADEPFQEPGPVTILSDDATEIANLLSDPHPPLSDCVANFKAQLSAVTGILKQKVKPRHTEYKIKGIGPMMGGVTLFISKTLVDDGLMMSGGWSTQYECQVYQGNQPQKK